ncbi:transcriptional regulator [Opitutaceae bacterium TAV1]|nr:transcriptional regulator [Opitutaceae bacterium TAV1]
MPMNEARKRVTQKDIARVAGVDQSTVSLALRNHPSIPEATRKRIADAVEALGYQPDPMLGALASYRTRSRPAQFHGTLAWLADWTDWRRIPHFSDYFTGASEQAQRHGFRLEEFCLGKKGMSAARVAGILRARGIGGILVCPLWHGSELVFPWEEFASVAFGYTMMSPLLHMVTSAHAHACATVVRRLAERGRKRIGFCLMPAHDQRVDHSYLAGYLTTMTVLGLKIPPLFDEKKSVPEVRAWIGKHRLDAVVWGAHGTEADPTELRGSMAGLTKFRRLGLAIPDELALGCPSLDRADGPVSGVYENSLRIGRVAMDYLVGMLNRGERGVPASRQRILVEGDWCEGATLPAVKNGK